jgi:hypothetical protein
MFGLLIGCASEPKMQVGPEADMSFDGLTRVDNTKMKNTWAKSGLDLSSYKKIRLVGAGIEYRSVKPATRSSRLNAQRSEFPLDASQREELDAMVREVFLEELAKNTHFEIVTEEGPDVLSLYGALLDIVSKVPPTTTARGDIYLSEVGEATLVLELRDSQSGEIFVRSIDRRAAGSTYMQRSDSVRNMFEAKRAIRDWAKILTAALDKIQDIKL